jgi:L-lactate dehydrogenase complex protein LldG
MIPSKPHNQSDLTNCFETRITAVGGYFAAVQRLSDVGDYVAKLASATRAKQIVVCGPGMEPHLFATRAAVPFHVASSMSIDRESFFEALKSAEIGVTTADLGVADTGTLIISAADELNRLVTALPLIHVAVLPRSKLVYSLEDASQPISQILKKASRGVSISLISASSRTSDVGGITILGAHGPKELHVLLLDEELPGES